MCPSGTKLDPSVTAPGDKPSDCVACTAGDYCSAGVGNTCPTGYQCPAYTEDEYSYPAQPGDTVSDG